MSCETYFMKLSSFRRYSACIYTSTLIQRSYKTKMNRTMSTIQFNINCNTDTVS